MKNKQRKESHVVGFLITDIISVIGAALIAWFSTPTQSFSGVVVLWILVNVAAMVGALFLAQAYAIVLKAASLFDAFRIALAILIVCILNTTFAIVTDGEYITKGTTLLYGLLLFNLVIASRFCTRLLGVFSVFFGKGAKGRTRAMIVGGGEAASLIVKELLTSAYAKQYPVCILDDDPDKIGKHIINVKIVGNIASAPKMAKKYNVDEIFYAIPSASRKRQKEIISVLQECKKPVKILPGIYELADGKVTVSKLRDVEIGDLLGREQVHVDLNRILEYIEDKTVLVTGGGGSIGSELCRQLASHHPRQLIILDIYENNAYEIEQELKRKYGDKLNLITLIASVRDQGKMRDVFEKYRPKIVFHAAAHKHVPLMETSPNEAVKNNVFGTLNVALLSDEYAVETFVQISTDKAVNPTNVMGATKRICEMIIQAIGKHSKNTKFVAVRFGNVLGSNGSVIP
ncbi:MAG: polysaccharide biosynthesis protein, partial [Candidatus Scatosoma sp.]